MIEHININGNTVEVALPDNWWSMSLADQESWLMNSDLDPNIAAAVEDQLSIGAGPGAVAAVKMLQTPFGTFKQSDILLYGGLALVGIIAMGVLSKQ